MTKSDIMTKSPINQWNDNQKDLSKIWQDLRSQFKTKKRSTNIPRASWPEENTEILEVVTKTRQKYHQYLNEIYFSNKQEVILELGADTRTSWSQSINRSQHLILRSSWSLREEHPDIWQIPIQELLALLENPPNTRLASQITTIIMENTLNCLGLDVMQKTLGFAQKYNIRIVSLKYRPLSAPSWEEIQDRQSMFRPNVECPSLLLAAQELLEIMRLRPADCIVGIYTYRPPMGAPIVLFHQFQRTPQDFQRFQNIQREARESKGSVQFLHIPSELMLEPTTSDYIEIYRETIGQLLMIFLSMLDRPKKTYQVHMMKETSVPHMTLVQAWFLGLANVVEKMDLNISMQLDTFGSKDTEISKDTVLHTADGELISPELFVQQWLQRGFDVDTLQKYAFGLMGDTEILPYNIQNNFLGEKSTSIFQATRIEIS
jgi:hypothetical protein